MFVRANKSGAQVYSGCSNQNALSNKRKYKIVQPCDMWPVISIGREYMWKVGILFHQIREPLICTDGKRAYWLGGGGVLRLVVRARPLRAWIDSFRL